MITSVLVLSAAKIARYCLKNETGNGRTLYLQALCNFGSINACTLMLDESHRAMNAILKASNLGFLENLTAQFLFFKTWVHQKVFTLPFNSSESLHLFKIFIADDLDRDLFLAVKMLSNTVKARCLKCEISAFGVEANQAFWKGKNQLRLIDWLIYLSNKVKGIANDL